VEQQVTRNAIAMLDENQSDPAFMANHFAEPRDFVQAVLHVSSEAL